MLLESLPASGVNIESIRCQCLPRLDITPRGFEPRRPRKFLNTPKPKTAGDFGCILSLIALPEGLAPNCSLRECGI